LGILKYWENGIMKSGLPVYPPKEGWYGWNYEKWKDGRMEC
jgi:hypothetical protein